MHNYLLTLLLQHNVVNYILQHSMSFKLMHAEVFWQVKNEQDCFNNVLRVFVYVPVCVLIHKVVYGGFKKKRIFIHIVLSSTTFKFLLVY